MVGLIGMAAFGVQAQDAATRAGFSFQPSLSLRQVYTNNVRLERSGDARSDLITDVSPGIRVGSRSGRIVGDVDYSLHGLLYARDSSSNEVQQSLTARGTAEAVENWAYVDASASISQQSTSALGSRSADRGLADANRAEVSTFQVSPYLQGRLGSWVNYVAKFNWTSTSSEGADAKSQSQDVSLHLESSTAAFSRLGWTLDLSQQTSEFGDRGNQDSTRINGGLTFIVTPEFRLQARVGRERNEFESSSQESSTTWGLGFTWAPTQRTSLAVTRDHRFFGNAYNVRLEHRTPRTVWNFSTGEDVSTSSNGNGTTAPRSVFDLLFAQFASVAPDPVQRAALVDAFLQGNGLTRATLANGGFLTTAASIQRTQNASVGWLGLRTTFLLSMSRNDARAANASDADAGDLSNGNNLHQTTVGFNISHRLTPESALSADYSHNKTSATVGDDRTRLRTFTTTYTTRLGKQLDLSVSARRALFKSPDDPYTESAVTANLRLTF